MRELNVAIRAIRKRLGKSMVQFADLVGCRQSTVSRYESGKLIPSRTMLILLLQLAQESEKGPILEALGVDQEVALGWREGELLSALKTFEDYLGAPARGKAAAAAQGALAGFAEAAKQIVLTGAEVDPALVTILRHWITCGQGGQARQCFRDVAAYLDVELTAQTRRRRPPRKP